MPSRIGLVGASALRGASSVTCAVMNRNVLNSWDVDAFLGAIGHCNDPAAIRRWLSGVARRWILKEFPAAGRVARAREGARAGYARYDIVWAEGADSRGETERQGPLPDWFDPGARPPYCWLDMDGPSARDLASRLEGVCAYFSDLADTPKFRRLDRIALPEAVRQAARFRVMAVGMPGDQDCNTLMRFERGYRMVLLRSAKDLELEGRQMRHCAGDYLEDLSRGCDLISLRDAKGRPHVTLEVLGGQWVYQVKGKANGPVAPRYRPMVLALLDELGLKLKNDWMNLGILRCGRALDDPQGWAAQPDLRNLVQRDILGASGAAHDIEAFYDDVAAGIDSLSEASWCWFVALFRQAHGGFARLRRRGHYDVGGQRFHLLALAYPDRLLWLLREKGRGPRCRALRQEIEDELIGCLFRFCTVDDRALVGTYALPDLLNVDFRRLRHDHQERVRRHLAKARREMRRSFADRPDYARLARWERDHRRFHRCLQESADQYL